MYTHLLCCYRLSLQNVNKFVTLKMGNKQKTGEQLNRSINQSADRLRNRSKKDKLSAACRQAIYRPVHPLDLGTLGLASHSVYCLSFGKPVASSPFVPSWIHSFQFFVRTNGYQAYTQGEHGHWICMTKMSQLQEQIYDKVLLSDSKNDSGSSDIRTTSGSSVAERHEMYLHGMAWHHYLRRPSVQSTIACRHPGSTTPGRVSLQVRAFVCISFVQTKKRGKSH